ncbi:MAG TPA: NAD-dependent epimerase/dehydratase family protein [Bdellovibrionales bacterium]|nr:NAD-dependent epimerase/dehydratase family protein [Bdellovibrionales bacterium]
MRILITGGAGFVGSHTVDRLLPQGHEILVIDNYATGRRDNLKTHPKLKVVEGTIANKDLVDKCFREFKPEIVIHAAAAYKNPDDWIEDTQTNVLGTVYITKASKEAGVKRIIYFQTALCYGLKPLEQPITFKHPLFSGGYEGGSSYAISKTGGEQYIELSGLDFVSFRLANAYGPRNISGPLPTFFQRLTTDKACFVMDTRRDFIYIQDLVDVVEKAVKGEGKRGYYHISTGSDFAIKDLYDETIKALQMPEKAKVEVKERNPDDVYTILIDPSKTEKDFAWKASTPLEKGVADAINYYREYGINQTFTHLRLDKETHAEAKH